MPHEDGPGNSAAKDSVPIPQIIYYACPFPAHCRMARFDGFSLGSAENLHDHDQLGVTIGMMNCLNLMTAPFHTKRRC
jgi:hypothetical protein